MFCRNCSKEVAESAEFCLSCGARPLAGKAFCNNCGAPTTPLAEICVKCGSRLKSLAAPVGTAVVARVVDPDASPKSRLVTALLAGFLGVFGAHCFYVGRTGRAVWMLVLGILVSPASSIWALVDLIYIILGKFQDKDGKIISDWQL